MSETVHVSSKAVTAVLTGHTEFHTRHLLLLVTPVHETDLLKPLATNTGVTTKRDIFACDAVQI